MAWSRDTDMWLLLLLRGVVRSGPMRIIPAISPGRQEEEKAEGEAAHTRGTGLRRVQSREVGLIFPRPEFSRDDEGSPSCTDEQGARSTQHIPRRGVGVGLVRSDGEVLIAIR